MLSATVALAEESGRAAAFGCDPATLYSCSLAQATEPGEINIDIDIKTPVDEEPDALRKREALESPPMGEKLLWGGKRRFTLQQDLSYVTSSPSGIETNRTSLRLKWNRLFAPNYYVEFDGKLFGYYSSDTKAEAQGKSFTTDARIKEFFVQGSWADTSVTLGQKVVVWGELETSTITDVFSPRNRSDFVFVSLDESRIGQAMLIVDHYAKIGQLTFYVNPDVKTDTDPVVADRGGRPDVINTGKTFEKNDPEIALRWKRSIGNGDFSLIAADLSDNQSVFRFHGQEGETALADNFYGRYQMVGAAANLNYGKVGLLLESAFNHGRPQETAPPYSSENPGYKDTDSLQAGFTASYNEGIRVWRLGLANQYTFGAVGQLKTARHNVSDLYLGVEDKFLHETLSVSYTYQYQFRSDATIHSLQTQYAVTDNFFLMFDYYSLSHFGEDRSFRQNSVFLRAVYNF